MKKRQLQIQEGGQDMVKQLEELGFHKTDELIKRGEAWWSVIEYDVKVEDGWFSFDSPYGTECVFIINKRDFQIHCYKHDYVYVIFLSPKEKENEEEVIGKLTVFYDDWRNEELDERAVLKVFSEEWVFIGLRNHAIEVVARLLNEDVNAIERILF